MNYSSAVPSRNGTPAGAGGIDAFDSTDAAPEFIPLPPGVYTARVVRGEFATTKAGADAYRIRFEITEGSHRGQTTIRTWTFGPRAIAYTKRDLSLFGLTSSQKLLSPFPEAGREYLVRLVVATQRGDDGLERSDIKRIDLLSVDEADRGDAWEPPEIGIAAHPDFGATEGGRG